MSPICPSSVSAITVPPIEPTAHAVRDHETMILGMAVHADCNNGNVLVKLTNCSSIVDRAFHRALLQLQRLQKPKPLAARPASRRLTPT
jgi:hypothetical protein